MSERLTFEYAVKVSIFTESPIMVLQGLNIVEAEENFALRRDKAQDHSRKLELDRIRALLKYAATMGGVLKTMISKFNRVEISLVFGNIEAIKQFADNAADAVESAVMK